MYATIILFEPDLTNTQVRYYTQIANGDYTIPGENQEFTMLVQSAKASNAMIEQYTDTLENLRNNAYNLPKINDEIDDSLVDTWSSQKINSEIHNRVY